MATIFNPKSLAKPRGYSNGMMFDAGRVLFVAGQVAWDANEQIVSEDLAEQFEQALRNITDVVREAGGQPSHIGRMTIFVVDCKEYIAKAKEIGTRYRTIMGKHYPAMTLVQVAALLEDGAKVEIEATAILP